MSAQPKLLFRWEHILKKPHVPHTASQSVRKKNVSLPLFVQEFLRKKSNFDKEFSRKINVRGAFLQSQSEITTDRAHFDHKRAKRSQMGIDRNTQLTFYHDVTKWWSKLMVRMKSDSFTTVTNQFSISCSSEDGLITGVVHQTSRLPGLDWPSVLMVRLPPAELWG